nr:putative ribonuclease H-like domain-containing protein [Tanacetum cinerariifolium]
VNTLRSDEDRLEILELTIFVLQKIIGAAQLMLLADERQVSDEFYGRTHILLGSSGKSASTLIDTEKPLLKDPDGEDCKKQTVVATSSIKAEYVAASSCCAQVLWIQNQLLDYGEFNPINNEDLDSTPKNDCFDTESYLLESLLNRDTLMAFSLRIDSLLAEFAGELIFLKSIPPRIDEANCDPEEDIHLVERLLYDKSSPRPPKELFLKILMLILNLSLHLLSPLRIVTLLSSILKNLKTLAKGFYPPSLYFLSYNWKTKGMLVGVIREQGAAEKQVQDDVDDAVAQGDDTAVPGDDVHEPSIPSPTPSTPPPQQSQDLPSTSQRIYSSDDTKMEDASNQGRMIDELDRDEGVALMDDKEKEKKAKEAQVLSMHEDEPEVQEVVDVVTTANLITEVVTAANTTIVAAEPQVPATTITAVLSKDKGKGIIVEEPKLLKKKQQVEIDEEYARKLHEELNKDIDWNVAIDHVKQKAKENPYVQRYQLEEEENRAIESINETPAQKAAKRRKLNEEVKDLKQHLEIVPDKDDDVYTEATLLARKVPVVDYEIIHFNNKPHYKIIRAYGTHQLYVSFITLLKNFDREDLESLWSIVKERFSTSKPNNFSDDFLLTTLGAMFERPDGQAQV